jgi:hypothetical protein
MPEREDDARTTDRDKDPKRQERKGELMGRKLEGQKFVSDEDIVKNRRTA